MPCERPFFHPLRRRFFFAAPLPRTPMAPPKGSWEGSVVTADDIEYLRRTRRLPPAELVEARAPGAETTPAPRDGEVVVFYTHFLRGLGLPVSLFFRRFLTFFGLQPHHLGPNAILQLAAFVTLCEGYVGILPYVELWCRLFYLKQQGASAGVMSECGAAVPVTRTAGPFPKLPLEESAKKWQKSFYVRNVNPADDRINLPPFADAPPAAKLNWGHNPRAPSAEIVGVCRRVTEMTDREGLTAVDLIVAFIGRRVLPLQRRPHRICDMSGRRDPCRLSTKELTLAEIAQHINDVSAAGLKVEEWQFGKEPHSRAAPAPAVSPWSLFFAASALFMRPDALGRLQHFPSQLVYDGPNPQALQPDRADSDPEEEGDGDVEAGGGEERLTDAQAGGSGQASKPLNPKPLREWPDDDEDDEDGAGDAAPPEAEADDGAAPKRRRRRAAGEPAGSSRPHGKQPAEARPAAKRSATAQPGAMKRSLKKARRVAPSAGPKRAIPTAIE